MADVMHVPSAQMLLCTWSGFAVESSISILGNWRWRSFAHCMHDTCIAHEENFSKAGMTDTGQYMQTAGVRTPSIGFAFELARRSVHGL
nr:hypothetical protein CFP56_70103 [Quercus suber]